MQSPQSSVSGENSPVVPGSTLAPDSATRDLTLLLYQVRKGEAGAVNELADAVYEELRAMARGRLGRDVGPRYAGVTIQPTMLASDTFMKLIRQRREFDNSGHFFALASKLMIRVLLDYHRTRKRQKRGHGFVHVSLEPQHHDAVSDPGASPDDGIDVEAFSAALDQLCELDPRKADVVRYRILWGLTVPEIAQTLDLGVATVERDWAFAKTWLTRELQRTS